MNLLFFLFSAFARDAISLEVISKGVVDGTQPTLFFLINQDLGSITVDLSCGKRSFMLPKQQNPSAGQKLELLPYNLFLVSKFRQANNVLIQTNHSLHYSL